MASSKHPRLHSSHHHPQHRVHPRLQNLCNLAEAEMGQSTFLKLLLLLLLTLSPSLTLFPYSYEDPLCHLPSSRC